MPTAEAGAPKTNRPDAPEPSKDELSTALGAAAEAGVQASHGDPGEIAADDAGGSTLSLEVDRQRKLPQGDPPGEGQP